MPPPPSGAATLSTDPNRAECATARSGPAPLMAGSLMCGGTADDLENDDRDDMFDR